MKIFIPVILSLLLVWTASAQDEVRKLKLIEDPDQQSSMYNHYKGAVLLEIPANGIREFRINTGAGEVEITPSNLPVITVAAEVVIMAPNAQKADSYLSRDMELSLERQNDQAILISSFDYENEASGSTNPFDFLKSPNRQINLKINVPNGIFLKINDNSGDLILANLKNNMDINDGSGLIYLNNIDGDIDINDNSGDIVLKNINKGTPQLPIIKIVDNSGEIRMENIRGNTTIIDASGDIRVTDLTGNLSVNDNSGDIRLTQIDGDLTIDDTSGEIIVRTVAGNIVISDSAGDIYIRDVLLNVNIRNAGAGGLTLEEVRGKVSGDLRRLNNH